MYSSKLERDIIETRTVNKHFRTTSKSIRDNERLKKRIKKIGIKMDLVSAYFENIFGGHVTTLFLLNLAADLEKKIHVEVDRLARRNRQALLCWFAENWDKVKPIILEEKVQKLLNQSNLITKDITKEAKDTEIDISDLKQLLNHH